MARRGRKYSEAAKNIQRETRYPLDQAVKLAREASFVKFDESFDVAIKLSVDPRKADQMVRGTSDLPHGTGKKIRVLVFAVGDKAKEASDAGADYVGGEELIKNIQQGWMEFEKVVATPDLMPIVSRLGKILGPRGLMPNPKTGTVTTDIANAVKSIKAGRVDFKVDKNGIIHCAFGRKSFDEKKLEENALALLNTLLKLKPASAKGTYLKSITISTTMGPGVKVDPTDILNRLSR